VFPVPEGIINHTGENYIGLTLWALDPSGAKSGGLDLVGSSIIKPEYHQEHLATAKVGEVTRVLMKMHLIRARR
jgi:hypothetical protein